VSGIIAKANTLGCLNSRCVVVNSCASGRICPVDGGMLVRTKNAVIADAICAVLGVVTSLLSNVRVVLDVKAEDQWVNVTVTPEQHQTKDWLCKNIEDAVENRFLCNGSVRRCVKEEKMGLQSLGR
jgi:hypothetical protein